MALLNICALHCPALLLSSSDLCCFPALLLSTSDLCPARPALLPCPSKQLNCAVPGPATEAHMKAPRLGVETHKPGQVSTEACTWKCMN